MPELLASPIAMGGHYNHIHISTMDQILREYYLPVVREQLNQETLLLGGGK